MSLEQVVQAKYAAAAQCGLSSDHGGVFAVARAFGYTPEELATAPAEANLGLCCGNPMALANLREGEVVVDLGCGGGLDLLLAAAKVGPSGKAIGIDMTPAMIALAERNAARAGRTNVELHAAKIDALPLAAYSVDCVISNCVINLAADKLAVFREIARVLKHGGRVSLSDIALKQPLPIELRNNLMAFVGCIAGAISLDDYRKGLSDAGLASVTVIEAGGDLNVYANVDQQAACCSPAMMDSEGMIECGSSSVHRGLSDVLQQCDINHFAANVKIFALKP